MRILFNDLDQLATAISPLATVSGSAVTFDANARLPDGLIDQLAYSAVFAEGEVRDAARWVISELGWARGSYSASIHELYMAAGRGLYANVTAPAINIRGLTYDMAQTIFKAAQAENSGIVVFEIARSEMGYTNQRPGDYAASVLAAAIAVGWQGPVFIQGDHFQANAKAYATDPVAEIDRVKALSKEAVEAGFYNIDIDASTLVDLSFESLAEQQRLNCSNTAEITRFIRSHEPKGITISIGGEIGEVGGRNSTVEDLDAFMAGYLSDLGSDLAGISKISVQTGTSHGGVVLEDGSIADVAVDFETLGALSERAKTTWGIGGAVQHGASTLPETAFGKFAEANAVEVHLATAFQNALYDHAAFPADLKAEIYDYLATNHHDERKAGQTDAQFYYTTRKRGFGPFKRELWDLDPETREIILSTLFGMYQLIFQRLNVTDSFELVHSTITPIHPQVDAPAGLVAALST